MLSIPPESLRPTTLPLVTRSLP
jgi:hypothetical protein